jgi:hypothetical protein
MSEASERLERWRTKKRKDGYRYIGLWVEGHVKGRIDELAWLRQQTPGDAVRDAVLKLLAAEQNGGGDLRLEARQEHRMAAKIREDILKDLVASGTIPAAILSPLSVVTPPLRPPPPAGMVYCRKGHDPHPQGKECPTCRRDRQRQFRATHPAPTLSAAELHAPFPEGCPPYDRRSQMLGPLCPKGHEHGTTGQSLRGIRRNGKYDECLQCKRDRTAAGRKKRTASPAAQTA